MQLIYFTYFGCKDAISESLKANPIHNALMAILPCGNLQPDLENYVMGTVLQTYSTKFNSMWNSRDGQLFRKMLAEENSKAEEEVLEIEDEDCKALDDSDKRARRINALTSMLRNLIYKN